MTGKVIDLLFWKQKKGIAPIGEWQALDMQSGKVVESGPLYDHDTYYEEYPVGFCGRKRKDED